MDLRLNRHGAELVLDLTDDTSSTRLLLYVFQPGSGRARMELSVQDVQELAGSLLGWLVQEGWELPELPVEVLELELDEDEDLPDPATVPEHTRPASEPAPDLPEHTRKDSGARWPDCASGWHDRCTASDRCGCQCHGVAA